MKSSFYSKRPWYHPCAIIRRLMNYYLLMFVALFLMQNSLLFPRWISGAVLSPQQATAQAADAGLIPWYDPTSGAASLRGFVRADFNQPAQRGTIVVFHGNGNCAFARAYYADAFRQRGFRTFLYEYPGYGSRPGTPSAASIIGDAQALVRSLVHAGYGPIYIWGESIGSGVAAAVCGDPSLPVHGLVLSSPWDTLTHVAQVHYPLAPVALLLSDKYDSIANLQRVTFPVCVIGGTADPIIPLRLSLNLFDHLPRAKKFIVKDGYGHGDWPCEPELTWWDDALNFVAPPSSVGVAP